ncbi:MAG: hypothetical protein IV090_12775 [Candidatus Sericytochromatia bacterium]|nr:hypothetical protein [Candidatus Sericytochromatia bacterium]
MRKPPISSWMLLAVIPLYFLLLESYPGFLGLLAHISHLPPRLQMVLPVRLPAQTPYTLYGSVSDPLSHRPLQVGMRLSLSSPTARDAYLLPVQSQKNGSWKLDLPELAPGPWQFKLTSDDGHLLLPEAQLRVENALLAKLRTDRQVLQPGETVVVEVESNQAKQLWANIPLELRLVWGQQVLLRQRVKTNALGQASASLQIPPQSLPGGYHLQLHLPRRLLAQSALQVQTLPPAPASPDLNLRALMPQLQKGLDQTLLLSLRDGQGRVVRGGWLRYQGKAVPLKGAYAEIALKAQDIHTELELTAGDAQGHLQKIQLPLEILGKGISLQPEVNPQGQLLPEWQVYSPETDLLTYAWGQGNQVLGQGQLTLKKGAVRLRLPEASNPDQHWLLLLLASDPEPQWLNFAGRVGTSPLGLSPASPDALSSLIVRLPALAGALKAGTAPFELSALQTSVGPPLPEGLALPLERPFLVPAEAGHTGAGASLLYLGSVCFYMLLGLLALAPLLWFLSLLKRMREQQPTVPFPSQQRVRRLKRALLVAQSSSLVLLFCLVLSWLTALQLLPSGMFAPTWLSALAILVFWLTLFWSLAPEWNKIHLNGAFGLSLWGPLQILLGISLSIYQPALLPAHWLAQALSCWGLSQALRSSFFPPNLRNEDLRQAWLLSGLLVLSLLHPLVLLTRGAVYFEPLTPERSLAAQTRSELDSPLQQSQPLQYTQKRLAQLPGEILLPPTFHMGPQHLRVSLRDSLGHSQSWQESLNLRPAVIPQLYAPRYALSGDQLQLALDFHNQTGQPQDLTYRFAHQSWQKVGLAAGETRRLWQSFDARYGGKYPLSLEQEWQGRTVSREQELYVLEQSYRQSHPQIQLALEAPAHEGLVPNEEVPVLLKISHSHGQPQRLGIQLGIPSGFLPLLDTLQDNRWLESIQQAPGYINLQTRLLPPGEELSFHYRLRSQYPGRVQMPPAQVFFMADPQLRLVETETPVFDTREK